MASCARFSNFCKNTDKSFLHGNLKWQVINWKEGVSRERKSLGFILTEVRNGEKKMQGALENENNENHVMKARNRRGKF